MQRLLLAAVLLITACDATPILSDAGVPTDGGPTPVCRLASENPDCMGDCSYRVPFCPPGFAAVCARPGGWFYEDGYCWLGGVEARSAACDGDTLPACSGGREWRCVSSGCNTSCFNGTCDPSCTLVCGATCSGWDTAGCACSSSRGCLLF